MRKQDLGERDIDDGFSSLGVLAVGILHRRNVRWSVSPLRNSPVKAVTMDAVCEQLSRHEAQEFIVRPACVIGVVNKGFGVVSSS
jgi:hypothetical protein